MQVAKIAELTGKSKEEVAEALGIPMEGSYWFKKIDDATAQEYIVASSDDEIQDESEQGAEEQSEAHESTQKEPIGEMSQFWSPRRSHYLPSDETMERGDIRFEDWVYVTESNSPEAKFLSGVIARDKIGIREILPEPYENPRVIAAFILYLEGIIYTGMSKNDGASREGIRCVRAILSESDKTKLEPVDLNVPTQLIDAVVATKSMNAQAFGTGV
jgi:hypothetical protein